MRELFSFPNPVNEKAARTVAGVVLVTVVVILATGWYWLLVPLAYGFWARVSPAPAQPPGVDRAERHRPPAWRRRPVPDRPSALPSSWARSCPPGARAGAIASDHAAADVVLILFLPARAGVDRRLLRQLQGVRLSCAPE